jgi:hypothetical protein
VSGQITRFAVAPALDGRIWVIGPLDDVYAARSNHSRVQTADCVAPPPGTSDI